MINKIDVSKRKIGVNFVEGGNANIVLWAPLAKDVKIEITSREETLPLKEEAFGYWTLTTDKLQPGDLYKFVLDNNASYPDPASLSQPEGVHGASEAVDVKSFKWTDESWKNIPLEAYVMYELHTGTFTPEGTFSAIEQKLDYLKNLGINVIEIMPVAQFPGSRNWGYDGVYPFAVQNSYGGEKGLKHLVNACHQKGIAVVLDVVYNHMGPEGSYFSTFGYYFTEKYNTPWGNAINFDDAWSDSVRSYFIENTLMWFRDFHIDALRLDAVHAIKDLSPVHILKEIKERVNDLMEETGRTHYLIVELDLNDTRFIDPLNKCGYGMDAQWVDEFHHALRVTSGQSPTGYYSDFSGITDLAKAYNDAYVYDGQYSYHRKKNFGVKADDNEGKQFIVFSQNHDQVGNRMLGERTSQLVGFEMQKLLAGAVMTAPFLPMLFMGEEWSEPSPFLYFVSHTDPDLVEAVRKGRKAEFEAFHIEGETPDPQSEDTFNASKLQWELLEKEPHATMLNFYKTLLGIRKKYPALSLLNRQQLAVSFTEEEKTLVLHRWHQDQHVICCMNFSDSAKNLAVPSVGKQWQKLLDSASPQWNGVADAPQRVSAGENIVIQPASFIIYINQQPV